MLIGFNDLATTNPEMAKEWHPTKNGELKPTEVTAGGRIRVWWMCSAGHEWQSYIYSRVGKNSGCAICSGCAKKAVRNIDTNEAFKSLADAAKSCGLKQGDTISLCCQGKQSTAAGYHWEYVEKSEKS